MKFSIKKGDQVVVISGNSKGTTGEVLKVLRSSDRVLVSGVNLVKKHVKASQDQEGGIMSIEAPIHISNVSLLDPKSGKATRVGRKVEDGKSVRFSVKSGEIIK